MIEKRLVLYWVLLLLSPYLYADDCATSDEIIIDTHEIFDTTEEDANWLQMIANNLHITTKKETVEHELAFLKGKCELSDKDIAEIKRHLRSLKYINEVNAYHDDKEHKVIVATTDKWSLMPTIDFSRVGGVNTFAFGIKDHNLFGEGISAEIEYFNDVQRSGYGIDTSFPLNIGDNVYGSVQLINSEDGSNQSFSVNRPFLSLDTDNSFNIEASSTDLTQQYFLNGDDYYELDYSRQSAQVNWGKLISREPGSVFRSIVGIDYDIIDFNDIISTNNLSTPPNRHYLVPYVEVQYLEDKFVELKNIHAINHIEDFNMGWNLRALFGVNLLNATNDEAYFRVRASASKGTEFSDDLFLFTDLIYQADFGETEIPRRRLDLENELIYRLDDQFSLYAGLDISMSSNEYFDNVIALGEDSGVRGYPLSFQRGESMASLNTELRYYPGIELFDIFNVGGAVFFDTGKVYKTESFPNEVDSTLSSVGFGLRFYTPHASHVQVIHLDFAFPTVSHENVGSFQISLSAKQSF